MPAHPRREQRPPTSPGNERPFKSPCSALRLDSRLASPPHQDLRVPIRATRHRIQPPSSRRRRGCFQMWDQVFGRLRGLEEAAHRRRLLQATVLPYRAGLSKPKASNPAGLRSSFLTPTRHHGAARGSQELATPPAANLDALRARRAPLERPQAGAQSSVEAKAAVPCAESRQREQARGASPAALGGRRLICTWPAKLSGIQARGRSCT